MHRGEIRLRNETLSEWRAYPLTRGVPLPPGAVSEPTDVRVTEADGRVLPSVGSVLQRRDDGSIEWLLMDVLVGLGGQEAKSIYIEPGRAEPAEPVNPVHVDETETGVTVSNGLSTVTLNRQRGSLLRHLTINGRTIVDNESAPAQHHVDLLLVDGGGKIHRASLAGPHAIAVTHANPLRTEVRIDGTHEARDGHRFIDFTLRFTLTANNPDLRIEHTFLCREDVDGRVPIRAMRLVMPTAVDPHATKLLRQSHHGHSWFHRDVEIAENVEVVASSVGDIDRYDQGGGGAGVSHPCAGGSVFLRNIESLGENWSEYPFHMRPGQGSGFRADLRVAGVRQVHPVVGWKDRRGTLIATFEHFRQLHPKAIELDENVLTWHIWPAWATPMHLVRGVSKSHVFWLTTDDRPLTMHEVIDRHHRWEYGYVEPVDVSFDPAWPAYCQVLDCHHLLRYQPDAYPMLENLIEPVPAAGNPNRHTYDRQPATGMFHFGDIVNSDASNCVNNEDDIQVLFPLQHYLRTGQTYAWDYGKEAARHYMEVDCCVWSSDPRQHGGLIPHTGDHFVGNVYPSHQWAEGLLAYYYLSGDERARRAVVGCGDNNVYWAYHETDSVCCDGREAGMPLVNLAATYRLTRDAKYLDAAKHIIEHFFHRWTGRDGTFQYPYPQGTAERPHKFITGYGDWSSFAGLYRLWEVTCDESFRELAVRLLEQAMHPDEFNVNDARAMDFFAVWALGRMTGDMDAAIARVRRAVPMLLRRGGHPLRRLHFLKELDERGMIDERLVGSRGGTI